MIATFILSGCGKERPASGSEISGADVSSELVILVGNSFIPPTEQFIAELREQTNISATFTTGGSEDLLPHIQAEQVGDIFITHDPYLDYVKEAGAYREHVCVGCVAPVLAVQKGNPRRITSITDLARNGLRVALSNPEYSTCGEMVALLLEKKGISGAVMQNVGNRLTKGHSNLGNLLKTGTVDAVVMWNGVAHTFGDALQVVQTPYEYDTEIRVSVIALSYSKHPELVSKAMVFAKKKAPHIFEEHGYVK